VNGWYRVSEDGLQVVVGAGFLGRTVAETAHERGVPVRLVTRRRPFGVPEGVEVAVADVRNVDEAIAACADADVVHDCLGRPSADRTVEVPVVTRGLLEGAAAGARIVVAAACDVHDAVDDPIADPSPDAATDRRRARATRARPYLADDRVPVAIGRASPVFGPGVIDTAPLIDPFGAALRGESVAVLGDPDQLHTFSFVPDVAAGLVRLATADRSVGGVWHLPAPETVTVRTFLETVFEATGADLSVRPAPHVLEGILALVDPSVRELRAIRRQFTEPFVVDHSAFADAFDESAMPLATAVERTLAWHRTWEDV
jgi:nucleoside-diphosphate-sugar epimerase